MPEETSQLRTDCENARNEIRKEIEDKRSNPTYEGEEGEEGQDALKHDVQDVVARTRAGRRNIEQQLAALSKFPARLRASRADKIALARELIIAYTKEQAAISASQKESEGEEGWRMMIVGTAIGFKLNALFTKKEIESTDVKEIAEVVGDQQDRYLDIMQKAGIPIELSLPLIKQRAQAVESAQKKVDSFGEIYGPQREKAEENLIEAEQQLMGVTFKNQMEHTTEEAMEAANFMSAAGPSERSVMSEQARAATAHAEAEVDRLSRFPNSFIASRATKVKAMQDLMLASTYEQTYYQQSQAVSDVNAKQETIAISAPNLSLAKALTPYNDKFKALFSKKERKEVEVAELGEILQHAENAYKEQQTQSAQSAEKARQSERSKKLSNQIAAVEKELEATNQTPRSDVVPAAPHTVTFQLGMDVERAAAETAKASPEKFDQQEKQGKKNPSSSRPK